MSYGDAGARKDNLPAVSSSSHHPHTNGCLRPLKKPITIASLCLRPGRQQSGLSIENLITLTEAGPASAFITLTIEVLMNSRKNLAAIMHLAACLVILTGIAVAQATANPNPGLVGSLTNELGVTPKQATGGAGAIFGLVKGKLNPADFSKIAAAVPGMDGFLKAAPTAGGASGLGSLASSVGGSAGSLPSLAGSFQSIGLSPSMVGKFVPVMQNYIAAKGGSSTASLFAGALK